VLFCFEGKLNTYFGEHICRRYRAEYLALLRSGRLVDTYSARGSNRYLSRCIGAPGFAVKQAYVWLLCCGCSAVKGAAVRPGEYVLSRERVYEILRMSIAQNRGVAVRTYDAAMLWRFTENAVK
jgi:hypothetical protein